MKLNKEVEKKLFHAADVADVIEICKNAGEDVGEEQAQLILNKVAERKKSGDKELSLEELEAVSGGADRDWLTNGCAATVEAGSWCWSNDKCILFSVTYDHAPFEESCSECGDILYYYDKYSNGNVYRCRKCGHLEYVENTDIDIVI